jgi:hypothetical protein
MAGRNSKPRKGGPTGHPGRLDQYGDKLGSSNEAEFSKALGQTCSTDESRKKHGK